MTDGGASGTVKVDAELPGIHGGACTCHAVRQAARRVTALYDAALAPSGLRISQFSLLVRLRRAGPMGVQALAAEMGLDRTTLGRNLRPLERDGLVRSEDDPADRRVRCLALTEAGLARMRSALPAWRSAQAAFEAAYGTAETAVLRTALFRVPDALGHDAPALDGPASDVSGPGTPEGA